MNCRDFRRRLLVDPAREDAEDARHAARCPACAAERARARAFEDRLRTLLAEDVETHPVPPAGRCERPRRLRMIPRALAATALLAFGLIAWLGDNLQPGWPTAPSHAPLATAVLDHIAAEPAALETGGEVPKPTVSLLLVSLGLRLDLQALGAGLEPVRYAARCRIAKHDGLHLVLTGAAGPVTLLLMPNTPLGRSAPIRSARFAGLLIPAGRGSLAIVGTPDEPVTPIARRIQRDLSW
jgi:hypothetical protein